MPGGLQALQQMQGNTSAAAGGRAATAAPPPGSMLPPKPAGGVELAASFGAAAAAAGKEGRSGSSLHLPAMARQTGVSSSHSIVGGPAMQELGVLQVKRRLAVLRWYLSLRKVLHAQAKAEAEAAAAGIAAEGGKATQINQLLAGIIKNMLHVLAEKGILRIGCRDLKQGQKLSLSLPCTLLARHGKQDSADAGSTTPTGASSSSSSLRPEAAAAAAAALADEVESADATEYSMLEMLRSAKKNADVSYVDRLQVYRVTVTAKTARRSKEATAQQAQLMHEARLLAVAVALRQLYTKDSCRDAVWEDAGLLDVIRHAYAAKETLSSSSSSVLNAVFDGFMPSGL
jgi:hypothetical protein